VDSVVESPKDKDGHEQDFFDGIDTTLPDLASRLGEEEKKAPWLREQLSQIQRRIANAERNSDSDSATSATALLSGRRAADSLLQRVRQSSLSDNAKKLLASELETKRNQFQQAANLALGVTLTASYAGPPASSPESAAMAVPGEKVTVKVVGLCQERHRRLGKIDLGCSELSTERARSDVSRQTFTSRVRLPHDNVRASWLHTALLASTRSRTRRTEHD
jgi:hypothetical protein